MVMKPTMVQLTDEDRALLQEGATRHGVSRSEVIRRALRTYLEEDRRAMIDRMYVEAYTRFPETDEEVAEGERAGRRLLNDPDLPWDDEEP